MRMLADADKAWALETAISAARAGGEELVRRFSLPRDITHKGKLDLLTDADTAAEARVLAVIRERHPDDAILAEESGKTGAGERVWIVDPLDGTTNYAHGVPHYAVSIAYRAGGATEIGVIYDPTRDELYAAARGGGATLNSNPIATSATAALDQAILATGFPYWIHDDPEPLLTLFSAFIRTAQSVRRFGSAALDLAWVASGRYDGFFEASLKAWDIAAGALLVEEAGGIVSALGGGPLDLQQGHILAANRFLHQAMMPIASDATRGARLR